MNNAEILSKQIVLVSEENEFEKAKLEWDLTHVYFESGKICLCSHSPIREICVLQNRLNKTVVEVGNCCVKKFLGIPSNRIFDALKRINKDIGAALNADAIAFAYSNGHLNEWEHTFYSDTFVKRKLTASQRLKRAQINRKLLNKIKVPDESPT